jgi:2-dehydro-3-deoxygluconokinase
VVKRGSLGAVVLTEQQGTITQPALTVQAVDTVGAGDSFTAGYLSAYLSGHDLAGRLRWALTCAACTVGTHGDWEGLPSRAEIEQRSSGREMTLR